MPGGDGTGPMGLGPMTGRAAGYCAGYPVPGYMRPRPRARLGPGVRARLACTGLGRLLPARVGEAGAVVPASLRLRLAAAGTLLPVGGTVVKAAQSPPPSSVPRGTRARAAGSRA